MSIQKAISGNEIRNGVLIIKTQGENPATSEIQKNTTYKQIVPTGAFVTRLSSRFDDNNYYTA